MSKIATNALLMSLNIRNTLEAEAWVSFNINDFNATDD